MRLSCSLLVLAPQQDRVPVGFQHVSLDAGRHADLLAESQRLRAAVYLHDRAIHPERCTPDGRYITETDACSFHVLALRDDVVVGAIWLTIPTPVADLLDCPLPFAHAGGWVVRMDLTNRSVGLSLALSLFALGAELGGVLALATVTSRHDAIDVLSALGGWCLTRYPDAAYGCDMGLMLLRSDRLDPSMADRVDILRQQILSSPIICAA